MRRNNVNKLTLCALLTALMFVLGYIENMLPTAALMGIPGVKIGLSNGVLLFALYLLNIPMAFALMVVKVLLASVTFASPSSLPFALAGGTLSLLAMAPLSKVKGMHIVTVSIAGAVMHNVGQVLMAMWVMQTKELVYYMAVLMLIGIATGLLTGIVSTSVIKHMKVMRKN